MVSQLPTGLFTATLTALKPDLSVDAQATLEHCRWLRANGSDGIVVLGTTGEANSFSIKERKALLEALVAGGLTPGRLLVGAGCCAVPDTVELAGHAVELGVGGVLLLPPFYYKDVSDDGLFSAIELIRRGVGDSRLKVYLYHIPQFSGVPISQALIRRLVEAYPDTVVGIKDSCGDWQNTESICAAFPRFRTYVGTEEFLLDILKAGGAGCISATTNVTSPLAGEIMIRWKTEDASERQAHLTRLRRAIERYPLIAALKHIISRQYRQEDWRLVRPPFTPLSRTDADALEKDLTALGWRPPELLR
jgi:4-hydroxy-tetrahydrodipicolinate synthase